MSYLNKMFLLLLKQVIGGNSRVLEPAFIFLKEVLKMLERYDGLSPDPSDITQKTIQELFYRQIKELSRKQQGMNARINTFNVQFSDCWF
jgi:hypothetical protein